MISYEMIISLPTMKSRQLLRLLFKRITFFFVTENRRIFNVHNIIQCKTNIV